MTTVSKNAAPVKTHRSKAKAEATRRANRAARHHGRFPLVVDGR